MDSMCPQHSRGTGSNHRMPFLRETLPILHLKGIFPSASNTKKPGEIGTGQRGCWETPQEETDKPQGGETLSVPQLWKRFHCKITACDTSDNPYWRETPSILHLIRHHTMHTESRPHKCLDCGKSFMRRSGLLTHQAIHTGERPYKCLACGKSFSNSTNFTNHRRIHTGERPDKCLDFGNGFCWKSALTIHQRIHTGERPYKCLECGKSFTGSSHLIGHHRIHTRDKPQNCLNYRKCFRSCLITHQVTHTGERSHKCLHCVKSFIQRSHLFKHQRIHKDVREARNTSTSPLTLQHSY
uniref:C2H2-type domain-containing protein n=1 Tax=Terrapene triunguis TaxID=2587831 RepID=A0A674J014_9SAUR